MKRSPARGRLFRHLVSLVPALIGLCCATGAHAAIGDYLYQWGAPYQFVAPSGIVLGADGRINVADGPISSFDSSGNLLGRLKTPNGSRCTDVAAAFDGRIYGICGAAIAIFESDGTYLKGFGTEGSGDGQFYYPTSLAVSDAGELYVGDGWNHTIQVFDRDGVYRRKWGTPSGVNVPSGMAFDAAGDLWVADYYNATITRYSPTGTRLDWWRVSDWAVRINGLAIDRAVREVSVIIEHTGEVLVFSLDGQGYTRPLVRTWHGDESGVGRVSGGRAKDLAIDAAGNVYIAEGHPYGDYSMSMIKKYDRSGTFQAVWQARGDEEGRFAFPISTAVTGSGEVLVADNGNRRIQRFTPEGMFAGAFALEAGCDTLEVEAGDDGLVYLLDRCVIDGAYGVYVASYTPAGNPVSRWVAGTYVPSFAVGSGKVFAAGSDRVRVFGTDGTPMGEFSSTQAIRYPSSSGAPLYRVNPYSYDPNLRHASDIELGSDGLLYVLDAGRDVVAFDLSGTAVRWIPLGPRSETVYSTMAVDSCGDIYALWRNNEISPSSSVAAFDRSGVPLRAWGTNGVEPGQFRAAFGIAVDAGRVFVVERDSHRVQVFEGLLACGQPVASAGADRAAHPGVAVTFDGSASTDPAGLPLSYAWRLVSAPAGSGAVLAGAGSVASTLVPDLLGDYVVELVVSNAAARVSQADQVLVTAANASPTVDAGSDQPVTLIGTTVALSGSGFDPDGDSLTYSWALLERPTGSTAALANAGSTAPTFTADRNGSYLVSLTVADPWGGSATDTVLVSFVNVPPVADAGRAQNTVQGRLVQLDGSASSDANGDALAYSWELVQRPADSAAVLTGADIAFPSFIADVPGSYAATLVVSDGLVGSAAALVTVTAVGYQDALTDDLAEMLRLNNSFPLTAFAAKNMQDTLGNKINAVIAKVESGNFAGALAQMQNDLLPKMDGCALGGDDTTPDWITGCDEQSQIYPVVLRIISLLNQLNS